MSYSTFKALHFIFFVSWFAGIFYLPRLFVYHATVDDDEPKANERYKVQERKLYKFITPFMVGTLVLGTVLVFKQPDVSLFMKASIWFHVKLILVILLVVYHFYLGHLVKRFAKDENRKGHVFYRIVNEVPALFFFAVVFLVVLKPF
ncbi:MAG: protoporphyrinogen oxidase HemJ [Deltaproteobacteria bacterium]|nr:protoporphyrinogen oxidase HemJ [Deltaproteobacteria bacterium]